MTGKLTHVDLDAAHPQDGAHAQVHHQKRYGVDDRRELAHRDGGMGLVIGGLGKTRALVIFAHKGATSGRPKAPRGK